MSAATAWMPLYVGDYLRDTRRLSLPEHGAYMLLLMETWTQGEIANDDNRIARILGCSLDDWLAIRPEIEPFFDLSSGVWRHNRIERERRKTAGIAEKRAAAGAAGAAARWQNNGKGNGKTMPSTTTTTTTTTDTDDIPRSGVAIGESDQLLEAWNAAAKLHNWPKVIKFHADRRKKAAARIKAYGLADCLAAIERAAQAKMLTTDPPPTWFDFSFLIRGDDSIAKIMEGKYDREFNDRRSSWDFDGPRS